MKIPYYQLNAFTDIGFRGNPAGVCLLDEWLSDDQMQYIAAENNLSETAFVVPSGDDFRIRWFTPAVEVDLCGHATLAAAHALFELEGINSQNLNFHSKSGILRVQRGDGRNIMDFPADRLTVADLGNYSSAFPASPVEVYKGKTDFMLVFKTEKEIREMTPDFKLLSDMQERGVIVTAPGEKAHFVSRFFAPQSGIQEDPVTGSAHTSLVPYWSGKLGTDQLTAWQLSERRGLLYCRNLRDRVQIAGAVTLYKSGHIYL